MRDYETTITAALGAASTLFLYTAMAPDQICLYDRYLLVDLHTPFFKAIATAVGVYMVSR
jgi:hypothetical protein